MRLHLSAAVRHWGTYNPTCVAIADTRQATTYAQLDLTADFVSRSLHQLGGPCDRVILAIRDKSLFVSAVVGCSRAGKTFVLANPDSIENYLAAVDGLPGFGIIISDDPHTKFAKYRTLTLDRHASDSAREEHKQYDVGILDEAAIIFTSGTSGPPKGVVRNNFSLLSEAILWSVELRLTRGSRFLIGRPLFYTGGFVFMYAALFVGGTIITSHANDENELYEKTAINPADIAFLVPHQVYSLLDACRDGAQRFTSTLLTIGAPISAESKQAFAGLFSCQVIESWGNSEGLGSITEPADIERRPCSIGRPCFCDSLLIADKEGNPLPRGEVGYLVGMSDNQFDSYLHQGIPRASGNDTRLIHSEDYGYQDADGFFYILGRECEKVKYGETELFPPSIEKIALGHPCVHDCALVKLANNGGPERLVLAACTKDDTHPEALRTWINARLSKALQLSTVITIVKVPRNAGGKIDRAQTQQMIEAMV